jgi:purine nucleosidase
MRLNGASQFIAEKVNRHRGDIAIIALGPLTNIAGAISIDPSLPSKAVLVVGGGSINCDSTEEDFEKKGKRCDDPSRPKVEFNIWFDPIASRKVLLFQDKIVPKWQKIIVVPADITSQAVWNMRLQKALRINKNKSIAAMYLNQYLLERSPPSIELVCPMYDEVVALAVLQPSLITRSKLYYLDVDASYTSGRGTLIVWDASDRSVASRMPQGAGLQEAEVYLDIDIDSFYTSFMDLVTRRKGNEGEEEGGGGLVDN